MEINVTPHVLTHTILSSNGSEYEKQIILNIILC